MANGGKGGSRMEKGRRVRKQLLWPGDEGGLY